MKMLRKEAKQRQAVEMLCTDMLVGCKESAFQERKRIL